MPRSEQSLMEMETIIRWDDTPDLAILWTASSKVRKEWESFGFKPVAQKDGQGWRAEVAKDRITYKPLRTCS